MKNEARVSRLEKHYSEVFGQEALKEQIPLDPQAFYEDFGFLPHEVNGEPVPKLAPYQYELWKLRLMGYKYRLAVKSQKCGVTTSSLIEDLQIALTYAKGKEILVIAQKFDTALEHLRTLKYLMVMSKKYSHYLLRESEFVFKEEKTKARMIYIRNPDNPKMPTRIIALGSNEASVWSWKHVAHIHMSDVAAINQKQDAGLFGAAFSRLANTSGTMLIETPPKGQRGSVYQIYKQSKMHVPSDNPEDTMGRFKVMEIPYREAIAAGVMTQEFIDGERQRLGVQFGEKYECEFLNPSNIWYPDELFQQGDYTIDL